MFQSILYFIGILIIVFVGSIIIFIRLEFKRKEQKLIDVYKLILEDLIYDRDNIWNTREQCVSAQGICSKLYSLYISKKIISEEEFNDTFNHFKEYYSKNHRKIKLSRKQKNDIDYGYYFPNTKSGNLLRIEFINQIINAIKTKQDV